MIYTKIGSPIGPLLLTGDGEALQGLSMQGGRRPVAICPDWRREDDAFGAVRSQLGQYFSGRRHAFELDLALAGNPFELAVWKALQQIPYGTTTSYGALAQRIGHPSAARAVGLANGRNPIALIVPCHRVIGADGSLTGFGGGLERKRFLLDLETGVLPLLSSPQLISA
ncbi:MAG: methylated-DNA--[protein]-cysteine S-methyltransferase [Solirubrobacteraceae bacterium]